MAVRIGIDVGGTFTDAVIIDNETFEIIGTVKIPTTHDDPKGVAAGVIDALNIALEKYSISPEEVVFIAHGTTQATNSLLEGDVEKVGVVGMGSGLEGIKAKLDTRIDKIELAPGKYLNSEYQYIDKNSDWKDTAERVLNEYLEKGIKVCVVSAAFSVDDPSDELKMKELINSFNLIGTCSHEISKLYGLKVRTRTAIINASILPKMLQTADMTQESVRNSHINAPLMIMRCDGGVMSIEEVKKRPILTILSGPAAGVAGALMYEKVSEGIFLEVGGTSTDISAIHNGKVIVNYAEVGGHKTYVNSLDIRTVGIGGGSMIRASTTDIIDIGPRSAHISGLPYLVYSNPEEISDNLELCYIQPKDGDYGDYVAVEDKSTGKKYALTLACAANAAGFVKEEDYAKGNKDLALKGMAVLSKSIGKTLEDVLETILCKSTEKNERVVKQLILDYNLDQSQLVLVGGGGGAAVVVPYIASKLGMKYKIANNAEVISPIGVALALVRDIVERTISNPTAEDILSVRREAERAAIKSGAVQESIEITVEIEPKKNIVRATAIGATEFKTKDRIRVKKTIDDVKRIAADSIVTTLDNIVIKAQTDDFYVCMAEIKKKSFFGLFSKSKHPIVVINHEGILRLHKGNGRVIACNVSDCIQVLKGNIDDLSEYGDGGEYIPECYILIGARIVDFSNVKNTEQIISLLGIELMGIDKERSVVVVLCGRRN